MASTTITYTFTKPAKRKATKLLSVAFDTALNMLRGLRALLSTKDALEAIRVIALEKSFEPGERAYYLRQFQTERHNEQVELVLAQTLARLDKMQSRLDAKV